MLMLTRKVDQKLFIGNNVSITITNLNKQEKTISMVIAKDAMQLITCSYCKKDFEILLKAIPVDHVPVDITIKIFDVLKKGLTVIGINAPKDIAIVREEAHNKNVK